MYKVGDFVYALNTKVKGFGVVTEVYPEGKYKIQFVRCENTDKYVKTSVQEVSENDLRDGMEYLNKVIEVQENYLNNLKTLKGVTAPKVIEYLLGE